ncbi:MAG: hypothetical protein R3C11_24355 [Planctomycetaceae bacterium]
MSPSSSNPDILKIAHANPGCNFDLEGTVRIIITKNRKILDELEVT